MLRDIVRYYVEQGNCIITASPGNGTTSLTLFLANVILERDLDLVYFNPTGDIERSFVKKYYGNVYKKGIYVKCAPSVLTLLLDYMQWNVDYLVIDPADCLMGTRALPDLVSVSKKRFKIIAASQIRQDPSQGGKVYSTLESLNIFDYSLWIRNVTEEQEIFKSKYLDIFDSRRKGNDYISRYVAKYANEGNVLDI